MFCLSSYTTTSITSSPSQPEVIWLDHHSEVGEWEPDCMQIDESSEEDSDNSSDQGNEESNDDTTATEIDLDSESGSTPKRQVGLNKTEENNSDENSSGEEDYLITSDPPYNPDMPTEPISLETFRSGNMLLRKGKTVELKSGDFFRIRVIVRARSNEVFLQGLRFQRSFKLDGLLTKHANEVYWTEEIFQDDSALEENISLGEVLRLRQLRMTNRSYEALNIKHTMKWPPITTLYRDEGILFCRMKYEVVYTDQGQKAKDNSFSFVEKSIRGLASEETDGEHWEDPADIRAAFRGDETPSMRRLRRSVSTMTLLGEPAVDDEIQEVPNPIARQKRYTFGDVFCGGGGMSCGAAMAGLLVRWGLDFNLDAMRTYQLNFKDATGECASVEHFLNADIYPPAQYRVDVLHMSPPCQSFSPAQTVKPEDFEDKQVVILAVNDLVKMIKPRIITMEETYGLLHEVNRDFFKSVVNSLTEQGYSVRWKVMNFIDYGVPQARRRVVLIAAGPGETLPPFPAPTHIYKPNTIASMIRNIPPNAPNHHPKDFAYPRRPYNANSPLRSLIATAGGDDNYHPSGFRGFTEREFACLQTFPRDFVFVGNRTAVVRQIGNAVPPLPGKTIYETVLKTLRKTDESER